MTRRTARWTAVPLLAAALLVSGPVPALDLVIGGPAVPQSPPIELPEPLLFVLPR